MVLGVREIRLLHKEIWWWVPKREKKLKKKKKHLRDYKKKVTNKTLVQTCEKLCKEKLFVRQTQHMTVCIRNWNQRKGEEDL